MNTGTAIVVSVALVGAGALAYVMLTRQQAAPVPAQPVFQGGAPQVQQQVQNLGGQAAQIVGGAAQLINTGVGLFNTAKSFLGSIF